MRLRGCFVFATSAVGLSAALNANIEARTAPSPDPSSLAACKAIDQKGIEVHYAGDPSYTKGNSHWSSTSTQNSTCVTEPADAKDVSTILNIVGNASAPFGIRSGGHTTNIGFSSTTGLQIALFKLSQVIYHPAPLAADGSVGTVEIGSGLIWDDVYAALAPHGVTAIGARASGVGVGGFILGGGYGFLSNQYGLAIDAVKAFEVVLPGGNITIANETKNPDLFWGLKGGFNNFGIVTKFTVLAFPQKEVWGGVQVYAGEYIAAVNQATLDFIANVKDPKASIIPSTFALPVNGSQVTGVNLQLFYDGPTPPSGIFERYTSIPHISSNVSTRSMNSLIASRSVNTTDGLRAAFDSVALKDYSKSLLEEIHNQTVFWGQKTLQQGATLTHVVEPFLPSMSTRSMGGAYPHDNYLSPFNVVWQWSDPQYDQLFLRMAEESAKIILNKAIAEGQDVAGDKQIQYGNYSPADKDLKLIYGANLPKLRILRKKYDPNNIMRLAGGFRF